MKWIGLCLLIAAGAGFGCFRAAALRERVNALAATCRFIDWMMREMRYTAAPLSVLLHRAAEEKAFAELGLPCEGDVFPKTNVKINGFTEEDAEHFMRFTEALGKSDVTGQLDHGKFYAALFEERRCEALRNAEKRGRVELMLWTGGAAVLALLLL